MYDEFSVRRSPINFTATNLIVILNKWWWWWFIAYALLFHCDIFTRVSTMMRGYACVMNYHSTIINNNNRNDSNYLFVPFDPSTPRYFADNECWKAKAIKKNPYISWIENLIFHFLSMMMCVVHLIWIEMPTSTNLIAIIKQLSCSDSSAFNNNDNEKKGCLHDTSCRSIVSFPTRTINTATSIYGHFELHPKLEQ